MIKFFPRAMTEYNPKLNATGDGPLYTWDGHGPNPGPRDVVNLVLLADTMEEAGIDDDIVDRIASIEQGCYEDEGYHFGWIANTLLEFGYVNEARVFLVAHLKGVGLKSM